MNTWRTVFSENHGLSREKATAITKPPRYLKTRALMSRTAYSPTYSPFNEVPTTPNGKYFRRPWRNCLLDTRVGGLQGPGASTQARSANPEGKEECRGHVVPVTLTPQAKGDDRSSKRQPCAGLWPATYHALNRHQRGMSVPISFPSSPPSSCSRR